MAGTHSFPALDSWYSLGTHSHTYSDSLGLTLTFALQLRHPDLHTDTTWSWSTIRLPVHTSDAFLHDALGLLENIWVLLINPVGQVPAIIQNLVDSGAGGREGREVV